MKAITHPRNTRRIIRTGPQPQHVFERKHSDREHLEGPKSRCVAPVDRLNRLQADSDDVEDDQNRDGNVQASPESIGLGGERAAGACPQTRVGGGFAQATTAPSSPGVRSTPTVAARLWSDASRKSRTAFRSLNATSALRSFDTPLDVKRIVFALS